MILKDLSTEAIRRAVETNYSFLAPPTKFEQFPSGVSTAVYCVEDGRGDRYTLRVYEDGDMQRAMFEASTLEWLASKDFPSSRPFRNNSGEFVAAVQGHSYALMDYIDGSPLALDDVTDEIAYACGSLYGSLTAELRYCQLTLSGTVSDVNPNSPGWRQSIAHKFSKSPGAKQTIERSLVKAQRALKSPGVIQVVHGDFYCENILRGEHHELSVIDFSDAFRGALNHDYALALTEFSFDISGEFRGDWCHSFSSGYRRTGMPIPSSEMLVSSVALQWCKFAAITANDSPNLEENPYIEKLRWLSSSGNELLLTSSAIPGQ